MRFTYSEMWWLTSRELRVAFVLMFLARFAYFSVLSVSSNEDDAPLCVFREVEMEQRSRGMGESDERIDTLAQCLWLSESPLLL